ncbi:MAG: hypothetical protein Q8J68_14710 [Methanolobus sp.]|uniref:hypothetical protein n=1 Tax=Methanolobus sp. TaxID=1874737 RepID=UPI0027317EFB|nr:hypothetical protein [Methanolobus sp.]MDP2218526.1 hypothetical protein [Methanolobus sp.]
MSIKFSNFSFGIIGAGGITSAQGENTTFTVTPDSTSGYLPATGEFIIIIYLSTSDAPHMSSAREGIRIKSRSVNTLTIKTRNVAGGGGQQAWDAGSKYLLSITAENVESFLDFLGCQVFS